MFEGVFMSARRGYHCGQPTALLHTQPQPPTPSYMPEPRKLTMSKRRLMMKQTHYCQTTSSGPICVMLMSFVCYMIYQTRYGADDDRTWLMRYPWRRRAYRWLTTSSRSRRLEREDVGTRLQADRRERDNVHRINDLFYSFGKGPECTTSIEGVTLQLGGGEGQAWSFILIPTCFILSFLTFLACYGKEDREARLRREHEVWQHQLREAEERAAAADAELLRTRHIVEEVKSAHRIMPEEVDWLAQLHSNTEFIKKKLVEHDLQSRQN